MRFHKHPLHVNLLYSRVITPTMRKRQDATGIASIACSSRRDLARSSAPTTIHVPNVVQRWCLTVLRLVEGQTEACHAEKGMYVCVKRSRRDRSEARNAGGGHMVMKVAWNG